MDLTPSSASVRGIWFTTHRYPHDLLLLETWNRCFVLYKKWYIPHKLRKKAAICLRYIPSVKNEYIFNMNTHSHVNHRTTTIWPHTFIHASIYAFIKICIVNNTQYHYILMKIPNKFQIRGILHRFRKKNTYSKCH